MDLRERLARASDVNEMRAITDEFQHRLVIGITFLLYYPYLLARCVYV